MQNISYIGIDVSKKTIDVSIFDENRDVKYFNHAVFANSKDGFKEMVKWLKVNDVSLKDAHFGLEFTGFYSMELERFLTSKEYVFTMLPTTALKHYPNGPKDKTDKFDSARIADYLYRFRDTELTKPYFLPSETLQRLKELKAERKFLVQMRTDFENRIQVCSNATERKRMQKYIDSLSKDIQKIELEQFEVLGEDSELLDTYTHLLTIPGIGHVNAMNVIVITRNFTAFSNARQYARYVGVAPCQRTSGTSVRWRPRPAPHYDGQAKADLSMAALRAVQFDAEIALFYQRKLNGKNDKDTTKKAMNAVKFKLILRMFAIGRQHRDWKTLDQIREEASLKYDDIIDPE